MITNFNIFGQLIKIETRKSLYKKKCLGMWLANENTILIQENTDKYPLNDDIINQTTCHEIIHAWLDKCNYHKLSDDEQLVDLLGSCLHEFLTSQSKN
jgi:hypothetical protein